VTIHDRNPQLKSLMGEIGAFLNLQPHTVKGVEVSLCADFEGHLGLDQRFYLLDFARYGSLAFFICIIFLFNSAIAYV
jgi:hypothetical protein